MKSLIVYGSQYGSAARYARKLAELTGLPLTGYREAGDLAGYGCVVYLGGLYAGGVKGLKTVLPTLPADARLLLATVGLADVQDPENIANIQKALATQLPAAVLARTTVFHLRGGIDYEKLTLPHRAMMALLYRHAKNLPPEKQSAEDRAIVATYNSKVDFVDFGSLEPLVAAIRQVEEA